MKLTLKAVELRGKVDWITIRWEINKDRWKQWWCTKGAKKEDELLQINYYYFLYELHKPSNLQEYWFISETLEFHIDNGRYRNS
jgi:hypothetical protein